MERLVANCFKAIMISIIMVVVLQTGFYVVRMITFDQKLGIILQSMADEVSDKNVLTESSYKMYDSMIKALGDQINGNRAVYDESGNLVSEEPIDWGSPNALITAYTINWGQKCEPANLVDSYAATGVDVHDDIKNAGAYGDIMLIQVRVRINRLSWTQSDSASVAGADKIRQDVNPNNRTWFNYVYAVPCLRYVQQSS